MTDDGSAIGSSEHDADEGDPFKRGVVLDAFLRDLAASTVDQETIGALHLVRLPGEGAARYKAIFRDFEEFVEADRNFDRYLINLLRARREGQVYGPFEAADELMAVFHVFPRIRLEITDGRATNGRLLFLVFADTTLAMMFVEPGNDDRPVFVWADRDVWMPHVSRSRDDLMAEEPMLGLIRMMMVLLANRAQAQLLEF